jgi:HK97 family phage major capsid protein
MPMYTPAANPAFLPDQVGQLVVQPVIAEAVATQAAQPVDVAEGHNFRVPIVAEDPSASWVAEGAEIPADDATLDEAVAPFHKLAGLTIISRELADDSSPQAAQVVGAGLARDIARKLDGAFFGVGGGQAPAGLAALAGVTLVDSGPLTNLDPFAEAISAAEQVGATLSAFVTDPATALTLATLKQAANSNAPLMQPDPTQPTRTTVHGVALYSTPAVTTGLVWGIPADRTFVAVRQDTTLDVDRSAFFTSDRVAIRATMRVGFAFAHPAAIVKVDTAGP